MARALSLFLILLVISPIIAADTTASNDVAIVHYDKLKAGKLEGNVKDVIFKPIVGGPDQTYYFGLVNTQFDTPRQITVRILGLTSDECDLYIDGKLVGTRKKSDLEAGIQISLAASAIPPDYRDYYTKLKASASEGAKRFAKVSTQTDKTCLEIMKAVASWVSSIERGDNLMRTTGIIVVPKGDSLKLPGSSYVLQRPSDFEKSALHLAEAVHTIRGEVVRVAGDNTIRHLALAVITPMDFTVTPSGPLTPGSKVKVTAKLTNWTDKTIEGKVKLNLPSGWIVKEINTDVKMPGYKKSAEATFEVTIPKNANPNEKISAEADLKIDKIRMVTTAQSAEIKK